MSKTAKVLSIVSIFLLSFCGSPVNHSTQDVYSIEINSQRDTKNKEFSDTLTSPLKKADIEKFKGLDYFLPDSTYRLFAELTIDTVTPIFSMATTTDRLPNYRVFGYVTFSLKGSLQKLSVYQNMDYKDDPVYGNSLFIPFRDATNGNITYEAGRYLDISIPEKDSIILDFNNAYNPYCAYNKRWSCPLVPPENWLKIAILAGEKKFK